MFVHVHIGMPCIYNVESMKELLNSQKKRDIDSKYMHQQSAEHLNLFLVCFVKAGVGDFEDLGVAHGEGKGVLPH